MRKVLVVGYDGSETGAEAVVWTCHEAAARAATVRVVSCSPVSASELEAAVASARCRFPGLTIDGSALAPPVSPALIQAAAFAELLVVGSTGPRPLESWIIGSVVDTVTRASPCPVVIVRSSAGARPPRRIVVGVDGSSASDAALTWAIEEAERHRAELVVVHTWWYTFGPDGAPTLAHDKLRVDAACVLERAVEHTRQRTASPVTAVLAEARPATGVLDATVDADLVVLGSRGRGAVRSMFFGSVARTVAERSEVPVVVVRAPTTRR